MVGPSTKRIAYSSLQELHKASERQICKTISLSRTTLRYAPTRDDSEPEVKLADLAEKYPTRSVDIYYGKIRLEGLLWNRKPVLRVYRKWDYS